MRVPVATYRLQINDDFTLHDARAVVPYLARLGITDLYLSPLFEARRGSTHGYDVTDPTRVRDSIGGMAGLQHLATETRRFHMGILLDIVPNHMAASVENPWWRDILAHGPDSRYARFFDIEWGTPGARRRLRLPILGGQLDELIDSGEITIDANAREIVYHDTRLPLRPDLTLQHDLPQAYPEPDTRQQSAHSPPLSVSRTRQVLGAQHYELAYWGSAATEVSYRRFFDITDLAGVRVEDDVVFDASHSLIGELTRTGIVTGLRIDHIDGLRDPMAYLQSLRERVRGPDGEPVYTLVEKILERSEALPADWLCEGTTGYEFLSAASGLLIHSEGHAQIEAFHHRITGDSRDFAELVREKKLIVMERLFGGELAALARSFSVLTGLDATPARQAIAELTASMEVYRTYFRSVDDTGFEDRKRIEHAVSDAIRRIQDVAVGDGILALRHVLLDGRELPDRRHSVASVPVTYNPEWHDSRLDWVMRWQQFTGPVMAKGLEDTALYCHNVLLAGNDVGIDAARPALSATELHEVLERRQRIAPLGLNATATHDTKRGEDTRARIAVLSELPAEWRTQLRRWIRQGDAWMSELAEEVDTEAPSADVESLLYQTLLGAWPLDTVDQQFRERIQAYMTKAVREAKEQTSWRRPDEDYEQSLDRFIELLMAEFGREGLADDIASFAFRIAPHGALNSIAQMLLKVTAPGIPDFYQGTELWSHTLVDPDNRANVDFDLRRRLFDDIVRLRDTPDGDALRALAASWQDGRIKLVLTALALRFRAAHRDVFESGDVIPLTVKGSAADHVFAFARRLGDRVCITVLPRWTTGLGDGIVIADRAWGDTVVTMPGPSGEPLNESAGGAVPAWHNALTGEAVPASDHLNVAALFRSVPFALLEVSRSRSGPRRSAR